jgi:[acyl-carrier-protein] S-malonyltransferase
MANETGSAGGPIGSSELPHSDPATIQLNLIRQLKAPVRWTQTIEQMAADGYTEFIEAGGKVLQGLVKKINRSLSVAEL